MSFHRIKIDAADKEFSLYIRWRDKRCQCCGRPGLGDSGIEGLECSHFFGRAKETTRFDPENADALCNRCHQLWEHEKGETIGMMGNTQVRLPKVYRRWKMKQLGPERFALLEVRANTIGKKDRRLARIVVRELMKTLPAA